MTIIEMIKSFQTLSADEQDSLLEIFRNHQAKRREAEILANALELKEAIALGTAKVGTVEDLITDLNEVEDEDIMV
ncbi:hypothetical protein [Geminocystis sp. GBBB08]|uniref:hypothetical protein n=1 Tax=Geminocystis sp. GBBB08 TaxID=2604140 RepID=UPI0027E37AE0|nr:hypothetical protein [Geminocystis sp. GBBB08]MBL1209945.1 hypothetical protein [Geminocystis sp. GBBB08]